MQLEFDPSTNEQKAPNIFVVVSVDNARALLNNLLSSEIKKDDVPLSARQHFLSALYEVWCMERRDLAEFGTEDRVLLDEAIENHRLLEVASRKYLYIDPIGAAYFGEQKPTLEQRDMCSADHLTIIDISDPSRPHELGDGGFWVPLKRINNNSPQGGTP